VSRKGGVASEMTEESDADHRLGSGDLGEAVEKKTVSLRREKKKRKVKGAKK